MFRPKAILAAVALAAQIVGGLVGATPALAAKGPADDRQLTAVTGWWTYTGVSASTLNTLLRNNGARLTSIQVDNASGPTFTAVMVKNTGAYASGYWWYYGQTMSQVNSLLGTNNARLISAHAYATSNGTRYAVVMVPNTGTNFKSWSWWVGTPTFIASKLSSTSSRLIQLSPMPGSSTNYLAIMVNNTGTNATGWWWYYGLSTSSLNSRLSTNKARLVDLSRNANGTWNGVMYADTTTRWYWYVNSNPSIAVQRAAQQGERIIDATSYYINGSKYFAVVETRNTNALSEKLWKIISPTIDSGKYGFYFKQVGGATLAGVGQSVQYEPASALKVLYHAKSIRQQSLGLAQDTDVLTYRYDPARPTNGGICPDNYATVKTTNLKNADQQMMWNSDNRMTRAILEKYGKASTLSFGATLGMTSTQINHNIGCPTAATYNKTTLVDLGKVYEGLQNNLITTSTTWKNEFRSRMLNQSNFSGFKNSICPIVSQEATALGKSATVATNFCNAMTWIAKGGSYQYGGSLPYKVSWDGVSMTSVPFKVNGVVTPRFYVFGEYLDGTTINSDAEATAIGKARSKEFQEAIRPYIRSALAGW